MNTTNTTLQPAQRVRRGSSFRGSPRAAHSLAGVARPVVVQVAKTEFLSLINLFLCVTVLAVTGFISPCFSADSTSEWTSSSIDDVRTAADGGNASAQWYLGYCYCMGHKVAKDWDAATMWFRKSADRGNKFGQNDLGTCYYTGQGVEKNLKAAITWYTAAANNGHPAAAYSLGWLAEEAGDIAVARQWYDLALKHGHPTAAAKLQSLQGQPAGTSSVPVAKTLHATASDSTLTARTKSVPSSPTGTSAVPSSWWSEVNDLLKGQYTVCGLTCSRRMLMYSVAITVLVSVILLLYLAAKTKLLCALHLHRWSYCTCLRCGRRRNEHHSLFYDCNECSICKGQTYTDNHKYVRGVCTRCYKKEIKVKAPESQREMEARWKREDEERERINDHLRQRDWQEYGFKDDAP
ncbi:MAG: sel1 repeat family protein [Verrucomicrobia bacterium]|nr:sel1 repeat family protein [Verrucomicrobiota bacterium]